MKQFFKNLSLNRGMSLVEIMIVIVVIGSIMMALSTQVIGRLKKSRMRNTKIIIGNVSKAIDIFYTDCGFYPDELKSLIETPEECSDNWGPDPYLKKFPPLDGWKKPLIYEKSEEEGSFVLKSLGSDGRPGGKGEKSDISSETL